jgi:hypothetical protein
MSNVVGCLRSIDRAHTQAYYESEQEPLLS